jgi:hypothetical protein
VSATVDQPAARITGFRKPEQILDLVENENVRDLISLIGMSQGVIASDGRPEWAIRAGGEFWRCCFSFSRAKRAKSENYRLGYLMGFAKGLSPQVFANERALKALLTSGGLSRLIHSCMENAPVSEAADFYAGLSDALRRPTNFSPSSPFLVYLLLAIKWREASTFKNTAQVHAWLESVLGPNLTGQRDRIAKLCQKVRFPFTDKGGRPKGKPRKPGAR